MPTCTRASLTTSNIQFESLNPVQQKAAMVYLLALQLEAINGPNYLNTLTTDLVEDANTLMGTVNRSQRKVALLNILYNNAVEAGAEELTVQEINAATSCCLQAWGDMDAIIIMLLCLLGPAAEQ